MSQWSGKLVRSQSDGKSRLACELALGMLKGAPSRQSLFRLAEPELFRQWLRLRLWADAGAKEFRFDLYDNGLAHIIVVRHVEGIGGLAGPGAFHARAGMRPAAVVLAGGRGAAATPAAQHADNEKWIPAAVMLIAAATAPIAVLSGLQRRSNASDGRWP